MNGKQIADIAQNMFGTSKITPEQLSYVLEMTKPVDGESEEDKELRLDYVRWYFESL